MHPFVVFHFYILYSLDNKGPDSIFTYKMYSACRFRLVIRIRVPANVSTCLLEIVVLGSKTNISEAVGNAFGINRHATNKEGIIGQGFENVLFHILSSAKRNPALYYLKENLFKDGFHYINPIFRREKTVIVTILFSKSYIKSLFANHK